MHAPVDLTFLADTVIVLRYFEAHGRVRRAVSAISCEESARSFERPSNPKRLTSAAGIARAVGGAGTATSPSVKERGQRSVHKKSRPCPRFSYRGLFFWNQSSLTSLKANSRDPRKAKLSRGGGRYINYTATHEGTTVIDFEPRLSGRYHNS